MKRRILSILICIGLILTGCNTAPAVYQGSDSVQGFQDLFGPNGLQSGNAQGDAAGTAAGGTQDEAAGERVEASLPVNMSARRGLLGDKAETYCDESLVPSVPAYTVAPDLSNVDYTRVYEYKFDGSSDYSLKMRKKLSEYGFAIPTDEKWDEFFELYESNRYDMFPSFITVDSLMHTYHLYFAHLMRTIEKDYLAGELEELSQDMLEEAGDMYEDLKGTLWETPARKALCFFYVGAMLQDKNAHLPVRDSEIEDMAREEVRRIMDSAGIETNTITGDFEDYTQYVPRGYYEGDSRLEDYFRTMMWYGRIAFDLRSDEMQRCAVMITACIDSGATRDWKHIYDVTSFFAGSSDDPGYYEMEELVTQAYGSMPDASDLQGDEGAFATLASSLKSLEMPAINSIPVWDGEDPVIPSFRFMGQRFTVDAAVMQKLIYSAVKENSRGENRMMPDTLDVAAALGSETARTILEDQGDFDYKGYEQNMAEVSEHFNNEYPSIWNASLYAGWLNTLRPLLKEKGEGYPFFMQNDAWAKKDLETFAGSYAELKHDTILYSKQPMVEMGGGGDEEVFDDRGYVEPEPMVYSRFAFLARKTREGLEEMEMLKSGARSDLKLLEEMALQLMTISEKELKDERLTDDEYEFIRCFGGSIEHFWDEAVSDLGEEYRTTQETPCPIIADIATDPNGTVLEVGTGFAGSMYVVFPIEGKLAIARGPVYSFYQFRQPMDKRLKDSEWRDMLRGGYLDDNYEWNEVEDTSRQPDWTQEYRFEYEW